MTKKRKTLDLGLSLAGKGTGGQGNKTQPIYGDVNHPALATRWAKVEKAKPGLKFMDLLMHGMVDDKPSIMKILNKLV